jgi:hypothetical protein
MTEDLDSLSPMEEQPLEEESSSEQLLLENDSGGSGEGCSSGGVHFLCQRCSERYRQPRVLHCLHVVCTPCLEKLASEEAEENSCGKAHVCDTVVLACPVCGQETHVGAVAELPCDLVLMNMMDIDDIRAQRMFCTSCKAQEKAVARCSDCASFLCPSCVTAHKFMRCFDNHKVESFEDLQKNERIDIHKPFFCSLHQSENVKFFCNTCQIPVCSECMLCVHKLPEHSCERISDVEEKLLHELQGMVAETKEKIASCDAASSDLETMLSDLQQQRDNAHDLIKETYQTYKAMLEKRLEELLKELDDIHSTNELSIMDMFHSVEKTVEKMEDGCRFTERILKHGNGVEVLSLKKHISIQLLMLLNNIPRPEPTGTKIEFNTDVDKFSTMIRMAFGRFRKPGEAQQMLSDLHGVSLQSSFEVDQFGVSSGSGAALNPNAVGAIGSGLSMAAAVSEYMPNFASLTPTSDLVSSIAGLSMQQQGGSLAGFGGGTSAATALHGLPQFAVERSLSRSSYSPTDSGISVDAASTAGTSAASQVFTLNAFSKLMGLNSQGQITMNGQTLSGLNFNNSSASGSVPTSLASRGVHLPLPTASDAALAGLLGSVTPTTPLPPSTPQLSDLFSPLAGPPSGHQLLGSGGSGGLRDGSPINVAVAAAAGLLSAPPPLVPLNGNAGTVPSSGLTTFTGGEGHLHLRTRGKISAMQIRSKFGQLGPGKGQFNSPHGFCLGMDEDIVVADTNNHRIQIFEKTGEFKYQFGIPGREEGQLWYPRKVAVIRTSGKYVVCDRGSERSRMQLFTKNGQFIKKIAIRYIDIVAGLAITAQGHIVAVDSVSPTVFCISESGDLIRWFDCSDYMREPSDIAISGKEYFVCDFKGHCVVVFNEDGLFVRRIGGENITNYPNGIDISDAGDVLVGDSHGNRFHIAVFQRDASLIGEFECPYVKVSRCCGLKITSEGYVVTLAKNNQHVLVLNTLYIA